MNLSGALQWFSYDNIPLQFQITADYNALLVTHAGDAPAIKNTKEAYSMIIDLTQNQVTNTADKIISVRNFTGNTKVEGTHVMRLN